MPFKDGEWAVPTPAELDSFTDELKSKNTEKGLPEEMGQRLERMVTQQEAINRSVETQKLYALSLALSTPESKVSIIMPIYNALHLAKKCFKSIVERTEWPYELILINDASPDKEVDNWLSTLSREDLPEPCKNFQIITNSKNRGFAATVNRGIRASSGKYICLMNSDVIVTQKWATKMTIALEANPSHVIVNPCTNNTALIDVPMQPGTSYLGMNRALERVSNHEHPEIMPTGFCFMFRRTLIDDIGYFDEAFRNYGEETDFWFKALKVSDPTGKYKRNMAVMADDCYCFHERGSSFTSLGQETHMGLRKGASDRFHTLHPDFAEWRNGYRPDNALKSLRATFPPQFYLDKYAYNIAWVVKSPKFCGGMKFIADIVNEMIEKGINAQVCVIKNEPDSPEEYLGELHTAPIFFDDAQDFVTNFSKRVFTNGIVVTAVNELVPPVQAVIKSHAHLQGMHHVQSYDPALIQGNAELAKQQDSLYGTLEYSIVSSQWVADLLNKRDLKSEVVLPGVETDLFHPGNRDQGEERFTILMPIHPNYWFKGTNRAVALAEELIELFDKEGVELRIMAYGVTSVPQVPGLICLGEITQARIATLLQTEVDLFIDPSYVHSYGMPAAEALASGVRVFSWENKGIHDVSDIGTTVFDNETTITEMASQIYHLRTAAWHPFDAKIPDRNATVQDFISKVEKRFDLQSESYRINVITPHARKHGGPTTIINLANILQHLGHDTNLVANYTDFNDSVLGMCQTDIYTNWVEAPECELMIINSDNPFAEQMMAAQPNAKKVMLKLSHNARFKAIEEGNLRLPHWDHIITSTDIMAEAAMQPHKGWHHQAWSEDKVSRIGWYHYSHPIFNCPPKNRVYGSLETSLKVGTLIHSHELKGSKLAVSVMEALNQKYAEKIVCVGIGEAIMKPKPPWLNYIYKGTREELASVARQVDIWIGASMTEGLGRLPLEFMSAGAAVVSTDTGAEFLKDGENCLLYPVGDAQACGNLVQTLCKDANLRTNLSIAGYNTAVQASNPETYVTTISKIISRIMRTK
jgi:GT2 family glycosyltransferase